MNINSWGRQFGFVVVSDVAPHECYGTREQRVVEGFLDNAITAKNCAKQQRFNSLVNKLKMFRRNLYQSFAGNLLAY